MPHLLLFGFTNGVWLNDPSLHRIIAYEDVRTQVKYSDVAEFPGKRTLVLTGTARVKLPRAIFTFALLTVSYSLFIAISSSSRSDISVTNNHGTGRDCSSCYGHGLRHGY
jgi:hypothetical protein